ncbi:hypothetical protein, partial [Yersinia pestis]
KPVASATATMPRTMRRRTIEKLIKTPTVMFIFDIQHFTSAINEVKKYKMINIVKNGISNNESLGYTCG